MNRVVVNWVLWRGEVKEGEGYEVELEEELIEGEKFDGKGR